MRPRAWFVAGSLVALALVPLLAQTIRSNATQFPSVRVETNGTNGAPSISFLNATTKGFFRLDANSIGLAGHFVPGATATYDLGSSGNKFRNVYLSGTINQLIGLFGDGSAGTPSISFTSAPTKGFYLFDATSIGVSGAVLPGVDNAYDLGGGTTQRWRNGLFSNLVVGAFYQVGAGVADTTNLLLRNDGVGGFLSIPYLAVALGDESNYGGLTVRAIDVEAVQLDPTFGDAQPTCDASTRGTLWFIQNDVGTADQLQVCGRAADSSYAWVTVL